MSIKRAYPGSLFDTVGVEKWLRELAGEGLRLEGFSTFGGTGEFRQDEPRRMRFHVEPDLDQYTSEEAEKAYREQGWTFVCDLKNTILVYETEDIMALKPTFKPIEKQMKKKLRGLWVDLILWLVGIPLTLWSLHGVVTIEHLFDAWSMRLMILLTLATGAMLSQQILMGLGKGNDIRVWKRQFFFGEEIESQPSMATVRYIQHWGSIPLICVCFAALLIAAICL